MFLSPFLDVIRMSRSTVYFLAYLDSESVPVECYPLTCNPNGFWSRVNKHLVSSKHKQICSMLVIFSFFLPALCLVVAVQSCME